MKKIVSFDNKIFRSIYKNGKSNANKLLVMYYRKNGYDYNRLGITVSKKIGNSVERNRVKRLIKESYRINHANYKCGYDIIFIARLSIKNATFKNVESALKHLMKKNNFINK
ncbi:MAG: ribonuclease P protein component [Eubacteriaceae bacterium]